MKLASTKPVSPPNIVESVFHISTIKTTSFEGASSSRMNRNTDTSVELETLLLN